MNRRILLLVAALLLSVGAFGSAALAESDNGGEDASVTVVHGVPDLVVDVYVNDDLTLEAFEPTDVAGPLALPEGTYTIDIRATGSDPASDPAISEDVMVPAGANASLVAHLNSDGTPVLSAFVNDVSALGQDMARLTVRHTAAAPAVDVRADGDPVFTGLENPQEASADVPAGTLSADVVLADTEDVVLGPADLELTAGTLTIVYAIGSAADETLDLVVQTIEDLPVETVRETARIAGPTRFDTAVAISQRAFPETAPVVYLARADAFADALVAGTLSDGPILLVPSCGDIPQVVLDEIDRLDPDTVLALGGTAAVCDATLAQAAS